MQEVVAKYDFRSFTSYVAKVGRAQFIEIHIAVTPDWPLTSIAAADSIRREIGDAIGGEGPQRWDHHRLHRRSALAVASRADSSSLGPRHSASGAPPSGELR